MRFHLHNGTGSDTAKPAVSVLRSTDFDPIIELDNNGNPYMLLQAGWSIHGSLLLAPSAGKVIIIKMIKKIEEAILEKLYSLEKIKLLSVPIIDFKEVRQSIILNLQYVSETFTVPNEKKVIFSPLPTKKRVSNINFSLTLYYKDLRNNFGDIYSVFDSIIDRLHGEQLEIDGLNLSPIYIKDIKFKEKNSANFIIYECNLEIRYCSM